MYQGSMNRKKQKKFKKSRQGFPCFCACIGRFLQISYTSTDDYAQLAEMMFIAAQPAHARRMRITHSFLYVRPVWAQSNR